MLDEFGIPARDACSLFLSVKIQHIRWILPINIPVGLWMNLKFVPLTKESSNYLDSFWLDSI